MLVQLVKSWPCLERAMCSKIIFAGQHLWVLLERWCWAACGRYLLRGTNPLPSQGCQQTPRRVVKRDLSAYGFSTVGNRSLSSPQCSGAAFIFSVLPSCPRKEALCEVEVILSWFFPRVYYSTGLTQIGENTALLRESWSVVQSNFHFLPFLSTFLNLVGGWVQE